MPELLKSLISQFRASTTQTPYTLSQFTDHQDQTNVISLSEFIQEFASILESFVLKPGRLVLLGDFNIHVDNDRDPDTVKFMELLSNFNLVQHITKSTHEKGHLIDLVITRAHDPCVQDIRLDWNLPSDHAAIHFHVDKNRPPTSHILSQRRKLSGIAINELKGLLTVSLDRNDEHSDVDSLVAHYNHSLNSALDKLAPVESKSVVNKPRPKWFSAAQLEKRRIVRSLERKWQQTGLTVDKEVFVTARLAYKKYLDEQKTAFYRSKIGNAGNTRALFDLVDEISGSKKLSRDVLPDLDPTSMPQVFSDYFHDKIVQVRKTLIGNAPANEDAFAVTACQFQTFSRLTVTDVKNVLISMKNKSCSLDPIPTNLAKSCLDTLIPTINRIVNASFDNGIFPENCKTTHVRPSIKRSDYDRNILKNYRPISNCSFLHKVLEKCAYNQISDYLTENNLRGKKQSAYRKGHSTETALLRIHNDVMLALDKKLDVVLVLLDLSAAFDTIDHDILLRRLHSRFGFSGLALQWIKSYLHDRIQKVCIKGSMASEGSPLEFGVPQGSILGPLLFSLYISPLEDIVEKHGCCSILYADDTQIYITCDGSSSISSIENCITEIKRWMSCNFLALNDEKTEVIRFSSKFIKQNVSASVPVKVGDTEIAPSNAVRNLGVLFDSEALMSSQVSSICKASFYALYRLGKIRKYLDQRTAEKLVHAFVSSRLDYCNSLLSGLPAHQLNRLQRVQNCAARLIYGTRARLSLHITPILHELHWLPVTQRIIFKIVCIVFKCIHSPDLPVYLKELVSIRRSEHRLRSTHTNLLAVPSGKTTKTYGDRAFSVNAPLLWNRLPVELRLSGSYEVFKGHLKTYLFRKHFSSGTVPLN